MIPSNETEAAEPGTRAGKRCGVVGAVVLRAVLAVIAVSMLFAGSASLAIAEDTCANAAVRAETNSTALPDCRAYEMVSPPYKEGFPVRALAFTDDGIVSYLSQGNFAGNARGSLITVNYSATRSSAGWITTAPGPPEAIYDSDGLGGAEGESVDLRRSLWVMGRRDAPGETFGYWLRGSDGAISRIGDAETPVAPRPVTRLTSADLSHIVFSHGIGGGSVFTALREHVGTGNGQPRLVSVDNYGEPTPGNTCPNEMSDDGRVIVYTSDCSDPSNLRIWARVAGSASVAVSGSECTRTSGDSGGACNAFTPAAFAGAARDGSRVFFTTSQQLVNGDTDTGNDLYACDIPAGVPAPVGSANACASLTQVSGAATNARVENVVAVSDDGSRVFFVAQGVLANNLGVGDVRAATPSDLLGAQPHNLYVWDRDEAHLAGQTSFVARVPSNDLIPPLQANPPQMTPDGRYLLFMTGDGLVADDIDGARDVYRYDAYSGVMLRVSTSVAGGGGNDSAFGASIGRLSSMSSDGSTVIFDTAEALSRDDTNGVEDVYSWHDGRVSLISAGGGSVVGVSPSGRDMFFANQAPVLAADGDVITDIYDARVGGGFREAVSSPCGGEQCQGLRSQPPGLAGSLALALGRGALVEAMPVFSLRAVSAAQRKKLAATGEVGLTVTTNAPGTISVKATATTGGRSVAVGSAKRTLAKPGRVAVGLTLSKKARAQLAARGRLTVNVAVSHSKVALDRSVTLRLAHVKARKSAKRASGVQRVGGGRS